MSLDTYHNNLEKAKNMTFNIEMVIPAKTQNASDRTLQALTNICNTIVEAYKTCNDPYKSKQDKHSVVSEITNLQDDLEWLIHFTQDETQHARLHHEQLEMSNISKNVEKNVKTVLSYFDDLSHSIERFSRVFEVIFKVLEDMTNFLKLGHLVEIRRITIMSDEAYTNAENMRILEEKHLLVNQAKLLKLRSGEFLQSTINLVKIQNNNISLSTRAENVEMLLDPAINTFILSTKEVLINPKDPKVKQNQEASYQDVKACLDEISKIVGNIKAIYDSSFKEEAVKTNADLDGLSPIINDLTKELAKLRSFPPNEPESKRNEVAANVPKLTKMALVEADKMGAYPEHKSELVQNVKAARDAPTDGEFFEAQDNLVAVVDKIKKITPLPQIMLSDIDMPDHGDLLEVAKAMCAALKNMNLTLDE